MARLILTFVLAFVAALGAVSGHMLSSARQARDTAIAAAQDSLAKLHLKAPADSAAADSAAHDSTAADSTGSAAPTMAMAEPTAPAEAHRAPAGVPAVPVEQQLHPPARQAEKGAPAPAAPAPKGEAAKATAAPAHAAAKTAELQPDERRLAKIFTAMAPKDAARVLEQMGDDDVRTILGLLKEKQAAEILTSFPPQRAAIVSRTALRTAGPAK